jgi:hypothetical protein
MEKRKIIARTPTEARRTASKNRNLMNPPFFGPAPQGNININP